MATRALVFEDPFAKRTQFHESKAMACQKFFHGHGPQVEKPCTKPKS